MIRSAVDLPQPEGPSRLRNSPLADVERHVLERQRAVREDLGDRAQRDERPAARSRLLSGARPVAVDSGSGRRHAGFSPCHRFASTAGAAVAGRAAPVAETRAYFTSSMPTPLQTYSVV